jgi:hypothetical protein
LIEKEGRLDRRRRRVVWIDGEGGLFGSMENEGCLDRRRMGAATALPVKYII